MNGDFFLLVMQMYSTCTRNAVSKITKGGLQKTFMNESGYSDKTFCPLAIVYIMEEEPTILFDEYGKKTVIASKDRGALNVLKYQGAIEFMNATEFSVIASMEYFPDGVQRIQAMRICSKCCIGFKSVESGSKQKSNTRSIRRHRVSGQNQQCLLKDGIIRVN